MSSQAAWEDERQEPREDVLYRTRVSDGRGTRQVTIVNISPRGMMARTAGPHATGDRITVDLPGIGASPGEVRWALGGRIGCRLDRAIGMAEYHGMLQAMLRD